MELFRQSVSQPVSQPARNNETLLTSGAEDIFSRFLPVRPI